MKDELFETLKEIIGDIFRKSSRKAAKEITEDMALREGIGMDSIDLVVLQIEIEDRWNIRFDPMRDDFQNIFYSMQSLCEFLERKIGERDGR